MAVFGKGFHVGTEPFHNRTEHREIIGGFNLGYKAFIPADMAVDGIKIGQSLAAERNGLCSAFCGLYQPCEFLIS